MPKLIVAALAGCVILAAAPAWARAHAGAGVAATACKTVARRNLMPGVAIATSHAITGGGSGGMESAYCQVDGEIDPHLGKDGKHYALGFTLNLPKAWNGRFLYQGGGGLNGSIRPALGLEASGDVSALDRGFAVVSTDSGHKGAAFDASFKGDQQAALDFAQASVGRVTEVAKVLVATYYGKPPAHSYFVGCSTGGREAMLASQRYPTYFDGIIAGAPAMRTGNSNISLVNAATLFAQIAPRGADGKPIVSQAITAPQKTLIVNALVKQCDALDGLKDGIIANTLACHFDLKPITCNSGDGTDTCLSARQADAVRHAFAAPMNRSGQPIYSAFPYDTGIADSVGGHVTGFLAGNGAPVGPPIGLTIDLDAREAAVEQDGFQALQDTATWTNLSTFAGHGGKLIFYHGVSDPWFSAVETARYYQQLEQDNGGAEAAQTFARLFLVPGMGHCGGGSATLDRFDALGALVSWVEDGRAPAEIVATGNAFPDRSRPLCPFPQHAQYAGKGDTEKASSFECRL